MASLEYRHVQKRFGDAVAVEDFSLQVADEEFLVLLGPSGCGKSTLLRLTSGLEELTDGEIYIDGRLANYVSPRSRDVAMVFQNYALYPHMTVSENIAFPLKMAGLGRGEIDNRVRTVALSLGILELLNRRPAQLSGGQRQRVALGRAVIREPKAYLMDEPLSNLDAFLRVQMREELMLLHRRLKGTVVYVTHDQIEAMTMGDRVVVMQAGRIRQVGPPQEVYDRPASRFVATFIGTPAMNLFEGRVVSRGEEVCFECAAFAITLPAHWRGRVESIPTDDRSAVFGVRSEHVRVNPSADEDEIYRGEVLLIERAGSDVYVRIRLREQTCIARVPVGSDLNVGESVSLSFDKDRIHIFATTPSGEAL